MLLIIAALTTVNFPVLSKPVFDNVFNDSTLRLDLLLSGNARDVKISMSDMRKSADWWGRRVNLAETPVQGNGQVIVKEQDSGDTLYIHSFSTLFFEWLATYEAQKFPRAEELVVNIPLPKENAEIEVKLFDNRREVMAKELFAYSPDDVNVRRIVPTVPAHRYICKSGDGKDKIDVALLAEGYTVEEMDSFLLHAEAAVESILNHEPFKNRASDFNFVAVMTPSADSGVSVPQNGVWKSTAFDSHYNTFGSPRYLTTQSVRKIHDSVQGVPYEHIVILANDDVYGGGGIYNFYTLTTSRHPKFAPVVVHEFGHSFGALADEYFYEATDALDEVYPLDIEPWEGNITTLKDFDSKWKAMLEPGQNIPSPAWETPANGIGVFEGGGMRVKGVYRPVDTACRMRFNEAEGFCPVCQSLINRIIDFNIVENND